MHRVLRLAFCFSLVVAIAMPLAAGAQSYPAKPVRIVVPVAPGGSLDLVARLIAAKFTEYWGQQVIVDNRAGAFSSVGTEAVVRSPADGYTMLLAPSGAITINQLIISDLSYDPLTDLLPITLLTDTAYVLLASNQLQVNSIPDLLARLRRDPGKLNHGAASPGSRLSSELLKTLAQVDYTDVNYRGSAPAVAAVSSGEVQFTIVDYGTAMAQMQAGNSRGLAVTVPQRFKLSPQIPTIAESGVPGYASGAWIVLMVPAKTPADIVAKINSDAARALASPDVADRINGSGNAVNGSSSETAARELRADAEKWAKLVKERNLKLQ